MALGVGERNVEVCFYTPCSVTLFGTKVVETKVPGDATEFLYALWRDVV
jgi:hypothetical protein